MADRYKFEKPCAICGSKLKVSCTENNGSKFTERGPEAAITDVEGGKIAPMDKAVCDECLNVLCGS